MRRCILLACSLTACASAPDGSAPAAPHPPAPVAATGDPDAPKYKPSSSSPAAVDITSNDYGAYAGAPDAPGIGDVAEDFTVPLADGGTFDLGQARNAGPVLVMFYRGFW